MGREGKGRKGRGTQGRGGEGEGEEAKGTEGRGREGTPNILLHPQFQFSRNMPGSKSMGNGKFGVSELRNA